MTLTLILIKPADLCLKILGTMLPSKALVLLDCFFQQTWTTKTSFQCMNLGQFSIFFLSFWSMGLNIHCCVLVSWQGMDNRVFTKLGCNTKLPILEQSVVSSHSSGCEELQIY